MKKSAFVLSVTLSVWIDAARMVQHVTDWTTRLPNGAWTVGWVLRVSYTIALRTSPAGLAVKIEVGHGLRFSGVDLERLAPVSEETLETAAVAGMLKPQVGEDL